MTKQQKTIIIVLIAVLAILALIFGWIIFSTFFSGRQAQAPVSTPAYTATQPALPAPSETPTVAPTATPAPEAIDPFWDKIITENKIVVGISADYPPYAYIARDFTVKGYDLALIEEIGRRLNLPLDIKNMAFDGLVPAVQLGQIDVAIAAISVTSERDAVVDFSNVYYVGDEAVLAKNDANVQINNLEDMRRYRVGVQRGSVYETWVRENLVDKGLMSSRNLISYTTPQEALNVLVASNPPIDIVVMDYQPAEIAIRSAPAKPFCRQAS